MTMAMALGFVAGVLATVGAVAFLTQQRMVGAAPSSRSFEATCAAVESVVGEAEGWSLPMASLDMMRKLADKGHVPKGLRRVRLFFVCNPGIAARVLGERPEMAGIMPCTWAVYERSNGSVWLAKMNIGLMARLFGGGVGPAMREVAAADERFLGRVLAADEVVPAA